VIGHGEQVLVLDMGTPMRILDLAENLIRLTGKDPNKDIPIEFIGLRPGEKLHEELLTAREELCATTHERIFVARQETASWPEVQSLLNVLASTVEAGDADSLRQQLLAVTQEEAAFREVASS